jgi:hypothetical protein
MADRRVVWVILALLVVSLLVLGTWIAFAGVGGGWQEEFSLEERELVPTGRNPFFVLEPGFQMSLEGGSEKLVITVLDETKVVDGVVTRVVEEREWKNGEIVEVSRNFFAICKETSDVFYFGEEVDMYKDGVVAKHEGAWLVGEQKARPGMIMSGSPRVGMKYYQEIAPGVAMDRAEVLSLTDSLETPAGMFDDVLRTVESTPLNPLERGIKTYAEGVGLIQDEKLKLTDYGYGEAGG